MSFLKKLRKKKWKKWPFLHFLGRHFWADLNIFRPILNIFGPILNIFGHFLNIFWPFWTFFWRFLADFSISLKFGFFQILKNPNRYLAKKCKKTPKNVQKVAKNVQKWAKNVQNRVKNVQIRAYIFIVISPSPAEKKYKRKELKK